MNYKGFSVWKLGVEGADMQTVEMQASMKLDHMAGKCEAKLHRDDDPPTPPLPPPSLPHMLSPKNVFLNPVEIVPGFRPNM